MQLNTASAVISHMARLETASADFYEKWAGRIPRFEDRLLAFANENRKNEARIRRAYNHSVTDALETNFSFKGLTADVTVPEPIDDADPAEVLQSALEMERAIQALYERAADSARRFLGDVSRVMAKLADGREGRIKELRNSSESESL